MTALRNVMTHFDPKGGSRELGDISEYFETKLLHHQGFVEKLLFSSFNVIVDSCKDRQETWGEMGGYDIQQTPPTGPEPRTAWLCVMHPSTLCADNFFEFLSLL